MDAWMAVQHLRFGPSLLFLRVDRVEFWPDKRGTVGRHLAQLLSDHDLQPLAPRVFANGSVAVQGFPALERLRSEEHTSELQSLMRISYAVFCLKKKKHSIEKHSTNDN